MEIPYAHGLTSHEEALVNLPMLGLSWGCDGVGGHCCFPLGTSAPIWSCEAELQKTVLLYQACQCRRPAGDKGVGC